MTRREITPQTEDAFLEDATNGWLDAADHHRIPHELAETILLDEILRDFHMADAGLIRAYALATLDALDAKRAHGEDSEGYAEACQRRETHGTGLVSAMRQIVVDSMTDSTVITGARLQ